MLTVPPNFITSARIDPLETFIVNLLAVLVLNESADDVFGWTSKTLTAPLAFATKKYILQVASEELSVIIIPRKLLLILNVCELETVVPIISIVLSFASVVAKLSFTEQ